MASAKDLIVKPIAAKDARRIIRKIHYSGNVCSASVLHFGVFLDGKCEGALQFGSPMDKRRCLSIVNESAWTGMLELNRMAFSDVLPRNSESRSISVAMRIIKKQYPQIEWVLSYADATQCGDGTIYRASGFDLIGVKRNTAMLRMPDGSVVADKTLNNHVYKKVGWWKKHGAKALEGYQLRYIYFINKEAKSRLTVPILPFSKIDEMGAGMYKGKKRRLIEEQQIPSVDGGASPTSTLHIQAKANG